MGTRSRIAVQTQQGFKSIYCHSDGYLDHNGKVLQQHYDAVKANQLVTLGNIDFLNPDIDLTNSSGWGCGEDDCKFATDATFDQFLRRVRGCFGEWYYVMRDGVWYVGNTYSSNTKLYRQLVPLAEALAEADDDE